MNRSSSDLSLPILDFGSPGTVVQSGDIVPIPNVAGMTVSNAVAALSAANFKAVVGTPIASTYPIGLVADTLPSGQALRATTVVILPSAGPKPPGATKPVTPTATPAANPTPTRAGRLPRCRPGGPRPCQ